MKFLVYNLKIGPFLLVLQNVHLNVFKSLKVHCAPLNQAQLLHKTHHHPNNKCSLPFISPPIAHTSSRRVDKKKAKYPKKSSSAALASHRYLVYCHYFVAYATVMEIKFSKNIFRARLGGLTAPQLSSAIGGGRHSGPYSTICLMYG